MRDSKSVVTISGWDLAILLRDYLQCNLALAPCEERDRVRDTMFVKMALGTGLSAVFEEAVTEADRRKNLMAKWQKKTAAS